MATAGRIVDYGYVSIHLDPENIKSDMAKILAEIARHRPKVNIGFDVDTAALAAKLKAVGAALPKLRTTIDVDTDRAGIRARVLAANAEAKAAERSSVFNERTARAAATAAEAIARRAAYARRAADSDRLSVERLTSIKDLNTDIRLRVDWRQALADARAGTSAVQALVDTFRGVIAVKTEFKDLTRVQLVKAQLQARLAGDPLKFQTVVEDIKAADIARKLASARVVLARTPLLVALAVKGSLTTAVRASVAQAKRVADRTKVSVELTARSTKLLADVGKAISRAQAFAKARQIAVSVSTAGFKPGAFAITGLGAAAAGALPGVAALAVGLSQIGPAVAILPAAIGGAAAAIVVLKKAFAGMGDAINAETPEAYAEALSKLPPQAGAAAASMRGLKDALDGDKAIQNVFWTGLAEPIAHLGTTLVPALRNQLVGIAAELNRHVSLFLQWAGSSEAVGFLNTVLGNTRQALANLSPAVQPVLTMFGTLAAVGSSFLPQLAAGLSGVIGNASGALTTMAQSGELAGMIAGALSALSQVGSILGSTFSILGSVLQGMAAGGGGSLGAIAATMERLAAIAATPEFQTVLTEVFSNLNVAFVAVAAALPPILSAVGALAPSLGMIGQMFGSVLTVAAGLLQALAPHLNTVVELIATHLMAAMDALAPLLPGIADVLGKALVGAFEMLAPLLPTVVDAFFKILAALAPLLPVLGELVAALLPPLMEGLDALTPILPIIFNAFGSIVKALAPLLPLFGELVAKLLPPLLEIFELVAPILTELFETVLPPLVDVFLMLVDALKPLLPIIGDLLKQLLPPLIEIIKGLMPLVEAVVSVLATIAKAVIPFLVKGLGFVIDVMNKIVPMISDFIKMFVGVGTDLISGLLKGLSEQGGKVIQFLLDMIGGAVQGVKNFLGIRSPSRVFFDIARFMVLGLVGGITALSGQAVKATSSLADQVTKGFGQVDLSKKLSVDVEAKTNLSDVAAQVAGVARVAANMPAVALAGAGTTNRTQTFNQVVHVNNPRAEASGYTINQATRMAATPGNPAARVFPRR